MEIKTVGIVGAGSLGVMYGNALNKALGKNGFCFIVDETRKHRYVEEGIFYNGERIDFTFKSPADDPSPLDLVIFTVKITALEKAMENAEPFIDKDTIILSFMNGISSETILGEKFGAEKVVYAVVQGMDTMKKGNMIHAVNIGYISLGEKSGETTQRILSLQSLFDKASLAWNMPENILRHSWSKLMLNTGVNQTMAVKQKTYGFLHTDQPSRDLMRQAMIEVQTLAGKEGILLTDGDIDKWFGIIDSLSPHGMPSMAQDVLAGRKTEVDLFAGTIKQLGKKHGIPTPVNDYLYDEIKRIEAGFKK